MSYFPIEIEVNNKKQVITTAEQLPQGVSFKVIRTNVKTPEPTMRDRYMNSYFCRRMLEKHSLDEIGQWEIYGEDPNCDFGGHHHSPYLETVEGSLDSVIDYAVQLPGFWQWGAGGEIIKTEVKKIKVLK